MDRFSLEILQRTVELAMEAMPPEENPRVAVCVNTILAYIESREHDDPETVRSALTELVEIARRSNLFFIAARLAPIAHRLGAFPSKSDLQ